VWINGGTDSNHVSARVKVFLLADITFYELSSCLIQKSFVKVSFFIVLSTFNINLCYISEAQN
jgi:hypothetical protein